MMCSSQVMTVCSTMGCDRTALDGRRECCRSCAAGQHSRGCDRRDRQRRRSETTMCLTAGCTFLAFSRHFYCCSHCKHSAGKLHKKSCLRRQGTSHGRQQQPGKPQPKWRWYELWKWRQTEQWLPALRWHWFLLLQTSSSTRWISAANFSFLLRSCQQSSAALSCRTKSVPYVERRSVRDECNAILSLSLFHFQFDRSVDCRRFASL